MKRALFFTLALLPALAFANDAPLTAPATSAPAAQTFKNPVDLTLGLFRTACLNHAEDRAQWAAAQSSLTKGDMTKDADINKFVKTLGWPTGDTLQNIWGVTDQGEHYVMIYDFTNYGCMLSSDSYIPPEAMGKFFADAKADQGDPSKVALSTHTTPKGSEMTLMTFAHEDGKPAPYILADTYKNSTNPALKTVLYFFRTDKNVKF